jgi:hypothetical protein
MAPKTSHKNFHAYIIYTDFQSNHVFLLLLLLRAVFSPQLRKRGFDGSMERLFEMMMFGRLEEDVAISPAIEERIKGASQKRESL